MSQHQPLERRWQRAMAESYRSAEHLLNDLELQSAAKVFAKQSEFPVIVPRSYAARMQKGNPHDPLLLQVIDRVNQPPREGFTSDPVGEHTLLERSGIIQKYAGRALVMIASECGIHCRYCFRREFPYQNSSSNQEETIRWLREHTDVQEVILSGGDPLVAPNQILEKWLDALATIPQLRGIRIHTRMPIVVPERMTSELLMVFRRCHLPLTIVVHANHPQELEGECFAKLKLFASEGVVLLNQSVLLAGVNDDVSTLQELSWRLREAGVLPYYLHLLDQVIGSEPFYVDPDRAIRLVEDLRASLPGYLVPKLVQEVAGAKSKVSVPSL